MPKPKTKKTVSYWIQIARRKKFDGWSDWTSVATAKDRDEFLKRVTLKNRRWRFRAVDRALDRTTIDLIYPPVKGK